MHAQSPYNLNLLLSTPSCKSWITREPQKQWTKNTFQVSLFYVYNQPRRVSLAFRFALVFWLTMGKYGHYTQFLCRIDEITESTQER